MTVQDTIDLDEASFIDLGVASEQTEGTLGDQDEGSNQSRA